MVHEHVSAYPARLYPCVSEHHRGMHSHSPSAHRGQGATNQVASSFVSGSHASPGMASGLQGGWDKVGETSERSAVLAKQPQRGWSRVRRGQETPEGSEYQRDAVGLGVM